MKLRWEPKIPRVNYLIASGEIPATWKVYLKCSRVSNSISAHDIFNGRIISPVQFPGDTAHILLDLLAVCARNNRGYRFLLNHQLIASC